jgi:RimJ/RimL family protein N-acetyltransferase
MRTLYLRRGVSLGPLLPEYAPDMYRWVCDPIISENIGLCREPSLERTRHWIDAAVRDDSMRVSAILSEGRHCGNVVIDSIAPHLGTGSLSAYIGEVAARGSGIGTTGMYLAIRMFFGEPRTHKINLRVHASNFPAIRAYDKLGFILEGILREEFLLRGERMAALRMGLLRSDFERLNVEWNE